MSDLNTRLLARIAEHEPDSSGSEWLAAALRAVVELHAPQRPRGSLSAIVECMCCTDRHRDITAEVAGLRSAWPCSTIQAIADQLGLTEGTDRAEAR